jgi:hypothetical protein
MNGNGFAFFHWVLDSYVRWIPRRERAQHGWQCRFCRQDWLIQSVRKEAYRLAKGEGPARRDMLP